MFDRRVVTALLACNAVSLTMLFLIAAKPKDKLRFAEIDAERINIVNAEGRPVLVLSNRQRIPGPAMNGKVYPREVSDGREFLSGMIFFNEEGDEVGGLVFNQIRKKDGSYSGVGHLSFDQWKQNQVVAIQYNDHGTTRRAGLNVWDRPTNVPLDQQLDLIARMRTASDRERETIQNELREARARGDMGVQRLFIGSQDRTAQVQLSDTKGRVRVRLYVDSTDIPRLDFLDEAGKTVASYPR